TSRKASASSPKAASCCLKTSTACASTASRPSWSGKPSCARRIRAPPCTNCSSPADPAAPAMDFSPDCPLCTADPDTLLWRDDKLRIIRVDEPRHPGYLRIVWQRHKAEMTD